MGRVVEHIHYSPFRSDIRGTDYEIINKWSKSDKAQYLIQNGEYVRHERIKVITEYGYDDCIVISFDIPDKLETAYYLKFKKDGSSS